MKIITAIASTTHIDRHNERMSKEALDSFAKAICTKFIPVLIDHDPKLQIGVLFYGKVIRLDDGEYALYVAQGQFESEEEKQSYTIGAPNKIWEKYTKYLSDFTDAQVSKKDVSKIAPRESNLAELLETHLDSTQIWTDGSVYKIKRFIASAGDLEIHVYPKDHLPAHFHVLSKQRDINARFNLENLDLINLKTGKIRESDVKKIKNFFELHPDELAKLRSEHKRMSI